MRQLRLARRPTPGSASPSRRTASTSARGSRHPEWGTGTVSGRERDQITVVFDSVGYRTLALDIVREKDLLRPAEAA